MRPATRIGPGRDLRLLVLALVAWAGTLAAQSRPSWLWGPLVLLALVGVVAPASRAGLVAALLVLGAVALVGAQHRSAARGAPTRVFAGQEGTAELELVSEAELRPARFGPRLRVDARLLRAASHGEARPGRSERVVLVLDRPGAVPAPGSRIVLPVRFVRAHGPLPLLVGRAPPRVLAGPGVLDLAVNRVRRAIREASAGMNGGAAALVPALVDGQESAGGGTDAFADSFRTAGLTHLLAVSGTNLTIVLGIALAAARWAGVRAYGLVAAGVLGVLGFVLLAGPEPSVLRAAAMGVVALVGLGRAGPGRGLRALGAAVLVLVLVEPALAGTAGFALSVIATAGILLWAPSFRRALNRWCPRWAAEAVAVPLAAQLACTPLVAALSGQVSLVALGANLVVAPLVAPATVLGLVGGLVALVCVPLGAVVAAPAGWCGQAMIAVAEQAAALPVPALSWGTSLPALAALTLICLCLVAGLRGVLARPAPAAAAGAFVLVAVLVPVPTLGWPPRGWVLVACDVGQGDALVLRAGPGSAVVIDAGPDPSAVDRCLRRLGVRVVPVLVLTHFHADHIDGLSGVLHGRRVGRIEVSLLPEPEAGSRTVRAAARRAEIAVRTPVIGERTRVGDLAWEVLAPTREHPESDSPANDASLVLLATVGGLRVLLLGDQETAAQADLRRADPVLSADVVKIAHHGSARQDELLLRGTGARLAVISVGAGNDYGHPAPRTLGLLGRLGMTVLRTDRDGDIALTEATGSGAAATVVRGGGA